jgi:hypothetical protein
MYVKVHFYITWPPKYRLGVALHSLAAAGSLADANVYADMS